MTGMAMRLILTASVFALAACGGAEGGNGMAADGASAGPVAAVAPPAGTSWLDTVRVTADGGMLRGNPDAAIRIIEFGSYTCPHCAEFSEGMEGKIDPFIESGKVSFEYRNFVRDPVDLTVALVTRCGGAEPFFALNHQMFANQEAMFTTLQGAGEAAFTQAGELPPAQRFVRLGEMAGLVDFAKQRGLPEPKVRQCLADTAEAEAIAKRNDAATEAFDIQGTPTVVINGTVADGINTWSALEARLREMGA